MLINGTCVLRSPYPTICFGNLTLCVLADTFTKLGNYFILEGLKAK